MKNMKMVYEDIILHTCVAIIVHPVPDRVYKRSCSIIMVNDVNVYTLL